MVIVLTAETWHQGPYWPDVRQELAAMGLNVLYDVFGGAAVETDSERVVTLLTLRYSHLTMHVLRDFTA